jgi:hypothetical protein
LVVAVDHGNETWQWVDIGPEPPSVLQEIWENLGYDLFGVMPPQRIHGWVAPVASDHNGEEPSTGAPTGADPTDTVSVPGTVQSSPS